MVEGTESALPELVVMVGLQASGKSTYVARVLAKDHEVVSKDHWPHARRREQRQLRVAEQHLQDGRSVVVDNTNASVERRAGLVALAHRLGVPVRAVFVSTPFAVCEQRNAGRTGRARVPDIGLRATAKILVPPTIAEGFDRVEIVPGSTDPAA
ncbi:MAG: AAA family ATPase [Friedmanniella sp.]